MFQPILRPRDSAASIEVLQSQGGPIGPALFFAVEATFPSELYGSAYGEGLVSLTIVDGMNVIGSRPQTRWWRDRHGAMRRLVSELEALDGDRPLLVVFDGYPIADLEPGGVDVAFAERRGPNGADDLIVELLDEHEAPESVVVVTSDAALRRRATALGATVQGASSLLRRL